MAEMLKAVNLTVNSDIKTLYGRACWTFYMVERPKYTNIAIPIHMRYVDGTLSVSFGVKAAGHFAKSHIKALYGRKC